MPNYYKLFISFLFSLLNCLYIYICLDYECIVNISLNINFNWQLILVNLFHPLIVCILANNFKTYNGGNCIYQKHQWRLMKFTVTNNWPDKLTLLLTLFRQKKIEKQILCIHILNHWFYNKKFELLKRAMLQKICT